MRKIWNTMLKGLVALLPIGLTVYLVYWLALTAERLFSGVLRLVIPDSAYRPGLGLVAGLLVLYLAGLAVNAYVVRRLLRLSDELFARIPVVKTLYVAIRDFMRFFPSSGQGGDLKRVVLVPFGPGKIIGFVTAESSRGARPRAVRRRGRGVPADELHGRRLHGVPAARTARADRTVGRGRHAHRADGWRAGCARAQWRRAGAGSLRCCNATVIPVTAVRAELLGGLVRADPLAVR